MITLSTDRYNLICGKTGYGKSTYIKTLHSEENIVVFDANNQHKGLPYKRYVPGEMIKEDFEKMLRTCYKHGKPTHFIVEEAQEVVGNNCSPYIKRWLRTGRNDGITATFITQIPADLHGSILSNSTGIVIFKLPRPEDRGYIAAWLGISGATVSSLPKYEYIEVQDDETIRGRVVKDK